MMTFEEWLSKKFGEISYGDFYSLSVCREAFEAGQKSVHREPLTEEEIEDSTNHVSLWHTEWHQGFYFGVRWAEKMHQIGEKDE
jgi:hypothetical protein